MRNHFFYQTFIIIQKFFFSFSFQFSIFFQGIGYISKCCLKFQCGCTGLNLQCITTTVFYEPTLSSLALDQAKARTHRRGQTNRCRYLYLSTTGSIEENCIESVMNGVDVTNRKMAEWGIILNDDPDDDLTK